MEASRTQDLFWRSVLLAACFSFSWVPPIRGGFLNIPVISIPETPAEGQNVTLSVENVNGTIREINWYRGQAMEGSTRLFTYFPGLSRPQRNGVQNTQREFGFPNGSLLITGVRPSDAKTYTVLILLRPKGALKGTLDLHVAGPVTSPPPTTSTTAQTPSIKEPTRPPLMLGWIVAGVVVGILLAGAVGAALVYRFVLNKTEPSTGTDPKGGKSSAPKHDDKEPIYEVMDSPVESPNTEGKEPLPMPGPLPPLPGTCPKVDSNYMELLRRTESVYTEIKR